MSLAERRSTVSQLPRLPIEPVAPARRHRSHPSPKPRALDRSAMSHRRSAGVHLPPHRAFAAGADDRAAAVCERDVEARLPPRLESSTNPCCSGPRNLDRLWPCAGRFRSHRRRNPPVRLRLRSPRAKGPLDRDLLADLQKVDAPQRFREPGSATEAAESPMVRPVGPGPRLVAAAIDGVLLGSLSVGVMWLTFRWCGLPLDRALMLPVLDSDERVPVTSGRRLPRHVQCGGRPDDWQDGSRSSRRSRNHAI